MLRRARSWLIALALASAATAHAAPSLFTIPGSWLDEDGRQVQLTQWRGKPTVMAMEYSACRFICSVYWLRLMQVQQEADKRGLDIQFVILSIDPEHDSPLAWREYRKVRNLQRANWHFLTGSRPMTTRAAALLGVRWWYDEDHLIHDFKIVRLDAEGRIASALTTYDEPVATVLVAK
jgi:cytochrome oxidase Cu insertion factor (SCO1/SenC/PrrC family)